MSNGRLFWGTFLLSTGILVLLDRLGWFSVGMSGAWRLWPVVLLLLGIALLVGRKSVRYALAAGAGLVLAILISGLFSKGWWGDDDWGRVTEQQFQQEVNPGTTHASVHVESGAGKFRIGDTTAALVHATTRTDLGEYDFSHESSEGSQRVELSMVEGRRGYFLGRSVNTVEMQLNAAPEWDIDLDVGAASVKADLSAFNVRTVSVDAGAASVDLTLGSRAETTDVGVNAGASSIHITVPESTGCEIRADAPLSRKKFPGFESLGSGRWRTENFATAGRKISISIDAGVSSLSVRRSGSRAL
jgi:hypothetical protein